MTESEWNSCTDLQKMLAFLHGTGRLTERKARLFAVAVCQTIGHFLGDEPGPFDVWCWQAVEFWISGGQRRPRTGDPYAYTHAR